MANKKKTIEEIITGVLRDLEKQKEAPKKNVLEAFDVFKMAEQLEVTASTELSEPEEQTESIGLICGTSRAGYFEV